MDSSRWLSLQEHPNYLAIIFPTNASTIVAAAASHHIQCLGHGDADEDEEDDHLELHVGSWHTLHCDLVTLLQSVALWLFLRFH